MIPQLYGSVPLSGWGLCADHEDVVEDAGFVTVAGHLW